MPRKARIIAPGFPHHITQRGNFRQSVFEDDGDRQKYLRWIRKYSWKYGLKIWAYCLMSNHVHFIAVPYSRESLSMTFNVAHMRYSQYFNRKKERRGHLWQGRFFSCCLDENHLYTAMRYVENNPVRAGLVEKAEDYPWSSAGSHARGFNDLVLSYDLPLLQEVSDWREYLSEGIEEKAVENLRKCTYAGLPAVCDRFKEKFERILGIDLGRKLPGRPRIIKKR